ncbi:hypothetical protein SERLA73DRAFT_162749 [Serpula lacrymans var. lacrymans S7.3]|uniref:NAD(P)-binding protein n=1 Tax=Serpula lacrymans var. lacrymans (strain S7.3) TaxID=936435 RepID=F8Q9J2_SERL3|nr:hypothetical protein SERLA73DRAFT_162749 [Serpula lacrymans var. lacrymans S7.3]
MTDCWMLNLDGVLQRNSEVLHSLLAQFVNRTQSEDAIRELKEKTGNEAVFLKLDLANLKFVKAAAEEFLSKETQLHVLFNNAGLMGPPIDLVTEDGYDLQFGTNVVGHHYFTKLLLPVLISTAKTCQDGKVRVVTTSSSGHHFGNLDFNTFKDGPARKKQSTSVMYSQSKYNTTILYSVQHGALTQLYAGTTAEGAELNGQYLIPWARVGTPLAGTQDPELGRALWSWLEEQKCSGSIRQRFMTASASDTSMRLTDSRISKVLCVACSASQSHMVHLRIRFEEFEPVDIEPFVTILGLLESTIKNKA